MRLSLRAAGQSAVLVFLTGFLGCSRGQPERTADAGLGSVPAPAPKPSPAASSKPLASSAVSTHPSPVGLDGKTLPVVPAIDQGPRIYARQPTTWIYERPSSSSRRVGALRVGSAVPSSPEVQGTEGCEGGWRRLVPHGFVCLGTGATLDPQDPAVRPFLEHGPDELAALPYIYGTVRRPGPIYARLPTAEEARSEEPELDSRMVSWLGAEGEIGAGYGQQIWSRGVEPKVSPREAWSSRSSDPLPDFLAEPGALARLRKLLGFASEEGVRAGQMEPKVGYSLLGTWLHEGRRFGLTTDLRLVPTDRLRPISGSSFHGFRVPEDVKMPFAIVRRPGAALFRYDPKSKKLTRAREAELRAAVALTGKQAFFRGRLHYETTEQLWLSDRDASRLDPAKKMPAWGKNGEKWIDVNITKQTLVLYEGTVPVYATLVSTGEAGLDDAEGSTATKRGIFRIHTKHLTSTMASDDLGEEFELRDVPFVQYFEEGYALHGAYWHDRFGVPKSHGCINLSPEDARRIFYWTEPQLPAGWHTVLLPLRGTTLFVHP